MIYFQDFVPAETKAGGLLSAAEYEPFEAVVARASHWSSQPGISITNVETVLLPNMFERFEKSSTASSLRTSGEMSATWHQIVRVWYTTE